MNETAPEIFRRRGVVILTFALPDESRDFVRGLTKVQVCSRGPAPELPTLAGELGGLRVTVVHTGVGESGPGRGRLAAAFARAEGAPVISSGYAGALDPRLSVGDLIVGENFSEPSLLTATGGLLANERSHRGQLVSRDAVAESAAAKAALHRETGGAAVDMETAWIAAACDDARRPMLSLRVISDAAGQDFPVPVHVFFDVRRQRPRYVALPAWLLLHPGRIPAFAAFVRGLGPARAALARALRLLLAGR